MEQILQPKGGSNNPTIKKEGNLAYMTYFRGFAIIMIVMVHCVTCFFDSKDLLYPYTYSFFVHSTNIFLFISGFLFEYLQYKKYTYGAFIKKKVNRLIVPYLFWAFPVAILLTLTKYKEIGLEYLVYTMWTGLNHGNNAHWYITFIFMVFLIFPLFRKTISSGKVLFGILMPLFLFLSLISGRAHAGWFYSQLNFFPLIGFFFLGMCFARYRDTLVNQLYKFDWLILLLGFVICFFQGYENHGNGNPFEDSMHNLFQGIISINYGALNKICFSIGFLLFFFRIEFKLSKIHLLEKLAHYSFAIYFVHLYIIDGVDFILKRLGMQQNGGMLFFLTISILILGISAAIVWVLRQIKLTRNIIGV